MGNESGEWEAVGPWAPSREELEHARQGVWSLIRLQWEKVTHEEGRVEHPESSEAMIGIYGSTTHGPLCDSTHDGLRCARTSQEIMLGFPEEAMSHEQAHEEIWRRLMSVHGLEWPQDWDLGGGVGTGYPQAAGGRASRTARRR